MGMYWYVERSSGVFREDEVGMKGPGVETLFGVSEGWSFLFISFLSGFIPTFYTHMPFVKVDKNIHLSKLTSQFSTFTLPFNSI